MKQTFIERPDGESTILHENDNSDGKEGMHPRRGEVVKLRDILYRISDVIYDLTENEIRFICAKIPAPHYLPSNY